jgi:hypothetical protein
MYNKKQTNKMNIPQIAKKYNISEAVLNSKDDAFPIIVQSLSDVYNELNRTYPNNKVADKLKKIADFAMDVKGSSI